MRRFNSRLFRPGNRSRTACGVAVLGMALLIAGTDLGGRPATAWANAPIDIIPESLGFTAAAFHNHNCQADFGGGPLAGQDVWVFKLPGDQAVTGDFAAVTATFQAADGTETTTSIPADGGGIVLKAGTSKAWIALPEGLTLTGASAEVTGTAAAFVLARTCPAEGSAVTAPELPEPSPSADPDPSADPSASPEPSDPPSAGPDPSGAPVAPEPSGGPTASPEPSDPPSAAPEPSGAPDPSASPTVIPLPARESVTPSLSASPDPSAAPIEDPIVDPSGAPIEDPIVDPSAAPSVDPSAAPIEDPIVDPSAAPIEDPIVDPSAAPIEEPIVDPSAGPVDPIVDPSAPPAAPPAPPVDPSAGPVPPVEPVVDPSPAPIEDPIVDPSQAPEPPGGAHRPSQQSDQRPVHQSGQGSSQSDLSWIAGLAGVPSLWASLFGLFR